MGPCGPTSRPDARRMTVAGKDERLFTHVVEVGDGFRPAAVVDRQADLFDVDHEQVDVLPCLETCGVRLLVVLVERDVDDDRAGPQRSGSAWVLR